jgi:hypothetical protein
MPRASLLLAIVLMIAVTSHGDVLARPERPRLLAVRFWNASDDRSLRRPSGGALGAALYAASVSCSAVATLSQMSWAAADQ